MIAEIIGGQIRNCPFLTDAVACGGSESPRIAAIGAGGKTTLLKRLAMEYQMLGQKPVVITTTHMKAENSPRFLIDPSIGEIMEVRGREGCVFAGARANDGKIKILPPDVLEAVLDLPCPILIEADGARRLPVKIPAEHEPVILPQITSVLSVYGLDAVGRQIREICFRADRAAEFLGKKPEDILDAGDIARFAVSSEAGRKGVAGNMQYIVVLNKADTPKRQELALDIGRKIEKRMSEQGTGEVKVFMTVRQNDCFCNSD